MIRLGSYDDVELIVNSGMHNHKRLGDMGRSGQDKVDPPIVSAVATKVAGFQPSKVRGVPMGIH